MVFLIRAIRKETECDMEVARRVKKEKHAYAEEANQHNVLRFKRNYLQRIRVRR